ncbi:Proposed peptidoglycan lipid II flippase MurJ [hydrothermal vent metagenome]|uniref:Proposed peptidoglycan lipid II flippase MurJ n=1 Tax=hydrothermal vent metagenome TaxID=652676 RepID=A0A3B0U9J8_9ZZZZ
MNLYRNFISVGAMTMLSRLLGFVRDIMLASVLGTGLAADAFVAAFRFPNLFRRLFAEGAFNAAFIPLFAGALERKGVLAARDLAARIISWLVVFLLVLTIIAEIFMPQIMLLFVPGFGNDAEKFQLTILLARISFPYLALMSLMAAYGALLNGLGKFLAAAFAPVMLNVVLVAALILLIILGRGQRDAATFLTFGVLIGGVGQLAIVIWALERMGFFPEMRLLEWDKDIKRFWMLALPAIVSGGVTQINIFVGTIIASGAASAISYLYYADRLYQLPLGIIGIAIGVALLPELSRHLKGGRHQQAREAQHKSLLIAMMLVMPAAAALFVLAQPIVSVLFERGAFDAKATLATAAALTAFAAGLPAFVLIKVFQPGFFAREDTMTPTILAVISVVINIALSLLLFSRFAHVGIAIATSVSAWLNALSLVGILGLRGHFRLAAAQWRQQGLILTASLAMGFVLWISANALKWVLVGSYPALIEFLALGILVAGGMMFYFPTLHLLGVVRFGELVRQMRR